MTNCHRLRLETEDGRMRDTDVAEKECSIAVVNIGKNKAETRRRSRYSHQHDSSRMERLVGF